MRHELSILLFCLFVGGGLGLLIGILVLRSTQAQKNPHLAGFFALSRTMAEANLVEAAGIEPASEGATSPALHA